MAESGRPVARDRWLVHPLIRGIDVDDPRAIPIRRQILMEKAFLRRLYEEWYREIASALPEGRGEVLELGSGGGFLQHVIPNIVTSELSWQPGVRVVLDGQVLPFSSGSLKAVVMTDVLHHLPDAPTFLREAARCVRPGGRLVMIEPWVSAWSRVAYTRLHHEPFRPDAATWEFPRGGPLSAANIALPWIIFARDRARFDREFPQWRVVSLRPTMPFRYLASGGISARALTPLWTFEWWRRLEQWLEPWMAHLGMFVHVVVERTEAPA